MNPERFAIADDLLAPTERLPGRVCARRCDPRLVADEPKERGWDTPCVPFRRTLERVDARGVVADLRDLDGRLVSPDDLRVFDDVRGRRNDDRDEALERDADFPWDRDERGA